MSDAPGRASDASSTSGAEPAPPLAALCCALGLGEDPVPVLEKLSAVYADVDREVAERARGLELPCRAGCDACCHEAVFVSAPELLAVAAELFAERTSEERRALVGEMCAIAERFADELELLETIPAGAERDEVAARIKFRCPLLSVAGTCSVYRSRELNARTFGQATDAAHGAAYGCTLTHARLRVLGDPAGTVLHDAREARRTLAARVEGTERVHVYPWWFRQYAEYLSR